VQGTVPQWDAVTASSIDKYPPAFHLIGQRWLRQSVNDRPVEPVVPHLIVDHPANAVEYDWFQGKRPASQEGSPEFRVDPSGDSPLAAQVLDQLLECWPKHLNQLRLEPVEPVGRPFVQGCLDRRWTATSSCVNAGMIKVQERVEKPQDPGGQFRRFLESRIVNHIA